MIAIYGYFMVTLLYMWLKTVEDIAPGFILDMRGIFI